MGDMLIETWIGSFCPMSPQDENMMSLLLCGSTGLEAFPDALAELKATLRWIFPTLESFPTLFGCRTAHEASPSPVLWSLCFPAELGP